MSTYSRDIFGFTNHSISLGKALDTLQSHCVFVGPLERSSLVHFRSVILPIVKVIIVFIIVAHVLFFVDIRG